MTRISRSRLIIASALAIALSLATAGQVKADAITKVGGTIVDINGKPLAKVPVYLEAVDIKKVVGPLKTNKKGKFFTSTLDRSVARKWRIVPKHAGYKTVKMSYLIIDSTGAEKANGERIVGTEQEHPDFQLALVGNDGQNTFNFVLARTKDYAKAVRAEQRKRRGESEVVDAAPEGPGIEARELAKTLEQAKQYTSAGRHEQAIKIYNAFLTKDPKGNPPVYYYLGKSLFGMKNTAQAEQSFRRALELQPNMKGCHFYLGNIAVQNDDYATAVIEFEKELELSPNSDSVLFNLGQAYTNANELDKALQVFARASELNPAKTEIYMQMAAVYETQGDTTGAEEMYEKVIGLDPKNAALSFYNIGVHAWNESRGDEAAKAFRKSLQLDPGYAASHRELARALMGLQDFPGALEHFEQYLELNPGAPDAAEIRDSIALLRQ